MSVLYNRFVDLVQREWLEGGHPFSLRHGHVGSAPERERSPMFLLFLDCVWQILQQFPLSFEFTEQFLHLLLTHSYSSEYGRLSLLCAAVTAFLGVTLCHCYGVPCVMVFPVSLSVIVFPVSLRVVVFPVSLCHCVL